MSRDDQWDAPDRDQEREPFNAHRAGVAVSRRDPQFDDWQDLEREPTRSSPARPALDPRGSVRMATNPRCTGDHTAEPLWSSLRRDGVMDYGEGLVLDHRTCLVCRGSYSREVTP